MLGVVQMKAWLVKLEEVCESLKFTIRVLHDLVKLCFAGTMDAVSWD